MKRPRGWLFPGQQPSDPLTAREFNRVVHAAATAAGLTKRVSMHTLRHSFATRRLLIHVLPSGFHRIRHCGLLASGTRAATVARARELLAVMRPPDRPDRKTEDRTEEPSRELRPCPCCGGRMLVIETF